MSAYVGLEERCVRLDRRHTRYRFDEERDIPWRELDAPGLHFGPGYLAALGIDEDLLPPAAQDAFQRAMALATCEAFGLLEGLILRFCAEERAALGPSRSVELLCDEEAKHMRVFARYGAHLRARHPALAARLAATFAPSAELLARLHSRQEYPSAPAYHYMFWINTVFFEEYTIWLDACLGEAEGLQPTWAALHTTHRQEEVQHVATDVAHLEALDLSDAERRQLSKLFVLRLEEGFDRLFGVEAALAAAADVAPEALRARRSLRALPLFELLLRSPFFKRTRGAAPYLLELGERLPPGAPEPKPRPGPRPPALLRGAPLGPLPDATLPGALLRVAAARPAAGLTTIDEHGTERRQTYPALLGRARRLLAGLRREGLRPGDRVLLVLPRPDEFVAAFWACQLGGLVPAPAGLSVRRRPEEDLRRLDGIARRLNEPLVLLDAALLAAERARLPRGWRARTPEQLACDEPAAAAAEPAPARPDDVALVQFSSGSTGAPRGVVLSHANVLANMHASRLQLGVGPEDVALSWMPLHHDMGLAYHLTALISGAEQVLMAPLRFARRPLAWLEAMDAHRATISASPSFGLAQVLRRLRPEAARALDLSPLRCVLDGAEPVSRALIERFADALAPAGLRREALRPAYGLAEATVAVTTLRAGAPLRELVLDRDRLHDPAGVREVAPGDPRGAAFVGVGAAVPGVELRIRARGADGEPGPLAPERVVGEVELRGPNVTRGYLDDPAATAAAFSADGWLRTGDLGLIAEGELFVTGRLKDVLFVGGRNFHAPDLEALLADVPGVAPDRVAVVGSTDPNSGLERVVPFVRVLPRAGRPRAEVVSEVAARLGEALAYRVEQVVCLPSELFPRTTSGKLQRHRLRQAFEAGELEPYVVATHAGGESGRLARAALQPTPPAPPPANAWVEVVRRAWAEALELAPEEVPLERSFYALGGDSIRAVEVHTQLEERTGRLLDAALLREQRSVRETAALLLERFGPPREPVRAESGGAPRLAVPRGRAAGDVAIVAMAGRFPGASSLEAFWALIREGRVVTCPVPADRFDVARVYDPDPAAPGKTVCRVGGFVEGVRQLDPEAFGLRAAEARHMDPQQRLFLEVAAEALGQAGGRTRRVGVFAGAGHNQYFGQQAADLCRLTPDSGPANLENMVAARVAAVLGLTGPALTVNAACATSLVAVHYACRALRAGECEVAVAGGVELNLTPLPFVLFSQAGVLSPSGRCRPFSAEADGFVPGEGAGAVVLVPLERALAEDYPILAVIKGSAVNNDGGALSGMAPNPAGQREVLRAAYRAAALEPATVQYVEAHGTGTPIGDPVEVRALAQVFGGGVARGAVAIGSLKANVGHLLNAAGVASLIKVVLALRARELPPATGCERPDPRIRFEETPFTPLGAARPWPAAGGPRRAGINAFGIGGTNCHLIVEEAPARPPARSARDAHLLCLAAHDEGALRRVAADVARALEASSPGELGPLAAALNARAWRFARRRALVARDGAEARALLTEVARAGPDGRAARGGATRRPRAPRLAFLLPGPGSQHAGMARHLLDEPAFAETLAACDAVVEPLLGRSLRALLRSDDPAELEPIERSQPVVFACSLALARWLGRLGVRPDAVIGHSAGEYAAAVLAGALSLEEAARLVTLRGLHMSRTPPGRMAAVFAEEEALRPALARRPARSVGVAALNEPGQVVVSGAADEVEALLAELAGEGIEARALPIGCAAHSPLMAEARAAFAPDVAAARTAPPALPFYSTLLGARLAAFDRDYWLDHLRAPVRFASAVRAALADGVERFVDLGGSAVLSPCVERVLEASGRAGEAAVVPLLRRSLPGWVPTLEALACLIEAGGEVDLAALDGALRRAPAPLPPYPYRRRELWQEPPRVELERGGSAPGAPARLTLERAPAVRDHRVHGRPIAPAALLIDRVLTALAPTHTGCALEDVLIGRPLALEPGPGRDVRVRGPSGEEARVALESREPDASEGEGWTEHLSARFVPLRRSADLRGGPRDLAALRARCEEPLDPAAVYRRLAASGLAYGPSVRTLAEAWLGEGELLARLEPAAEGAAGGAPSRLDPGLVDGAMQAIAGLTLAHPLEGATFLGFSIRRLVVQAPVERGCWAHVHLRSALDGESESFRCDVELLGPSGRVLATFEQVGLKRLWPREQAGLLGPPARAWRIELEPLAGELPARPRLDASATVLLVGAPSPLRTALEREVEAAGGVALPTAPEALLAHAPRLLGGRARVALLELELEALGAACGALARAVAAGAGSPAALAVVTAEEAALGFVRALDRERPEWGCRALHLAAGEPPPAGELARRCLVALAGREPAPRLVCELHDGEPRAPRLAPLALTVPEGAPPAPFRAGGVYWITGGLGGLGLAVGELLASRLGARLLLSGRRARPDPEALARIERAGGEALYVSADAADPAALRRALEAARAAWGEVHGVIHAAGALADALVGERTPARTRAVLAPKLEGARALAAVTEGEPLELFCLFSSLSALLGVPGQTDYAAANAGLDGLARRLRRRGCAVLSLAWGPWREVGMVQDEAYQRAFAAQGLRPLAAAAGAEAFWAAVALAAGEGLRHLVVADVAPRREAALAEAFNRPAGAARRAARERSAPGSEPGAARGPAAVVRAYVTERLAGHLRQAPGAIDTRAPLQSLGVDSLMAVGLVRDLERRFALRLYPTLLFEVPTIDDLAEHLAAEHGAAIQAAAAAPAPGAAPRADPASARSPGEEAAGAWWVGVEPGRLLAGPLALAPPGPGEVELEVRAVGVNFIDLLAVAGAHPVHGAGRFVPGHEVAGVVRAVGPGVDDLAPGERVIALIASGGYAPRVVAPRAACLPLPAALDFTAGAAVLVTGLTAIACVEEKGRVAPGERVLVQAAAGATGLACVQLALHRGAEVLGTASHPDKLRRLGALGVAHPIDYRAEPFDAAVRRLTAGEGVDVVIDSLSGDAIPRGLALLRPGGRFVELGAAGVIDPPPVDPAQLFLADQDFATVNVARLAASPARLRAHARRLLELLEQGVLRPEVGHVLPLGEAEEAHRLLRERRNYGKVVLAVEG